MPFKTGSWGEEAKERSKRRTSYFIFNKIRSPEKTNARQIICFLVKKGVMKKGECEMKDISCHGRIEGHHIDYTKPMEVMWLCSFHHRAKHKEVSNPKLLIHREP